MSGLKKFLNRRAENLAKEKNRKSGINTEDINEKDIEEADLTDDEFWEISNQFMSERKKSNKSEVEILQNILIKYSPLKIQQFASRFEELNK